MSAMADKNVQVSTEIARDAGALYDMVAELCDMGQWSPEAQGGKWVGGATGPAKGAKFRGSNRKGWRRWQTVAEVTDAVPGTRFAFRVTVGPLPIAEWTYDFEAAGTGTKVTESWQDIRPAWMPVVDPVMMGVADRAEHNRKNMEATLAALKSGAEAA
jgi:hypothetical protein